MRRSFCLAEDTLYVPPAGRDLYRLVNGRNSGSRSRQTSDDCLVFSTPFGTLASSATRKSSFDKALVFRSRSPTGPRKVPLGKRDLHARLPKAERASILRNAAVRPGFSWGAAWVRMFWPAMRNHSGGGHGSMRPFGQTEQTNLVVNLSSAGRRRRTGPRRRRHYHSGPFKSPSAIPFIGGGIR